VKRLLIALLVLAGAVALLYGVFLPSAQRQQKEEAFQQATRTQIDTFRTSLAAFQKDCDRLPSSEEGLRALMEKPANVSDNQWHGPYLDLIPTDPWGRSYVYRCPGQHGTNRFEIYSNGPDGVSRSGGEDADDIASWVGRGVR
jgi:general secretion pathway protein G